MAKPKQKHGSKRVNKRNVFLIAAGLVIILLGALVAVKVYETNKTREDQKSLLNKSLYATQGVYSKLSDGVSSLRQQEHPPLNSCTKVGAKYSTAFNCGPTAQLTVSELDEGQYIELNRKAIDIYKEDGEFSQVGFTEPKEDGLEPGLTGTASSIFDGSDVQCFYSSNYRVEKKSATFSWGCNLVVESQLFPLED